MSHLILESLDLLHEHVYVNFNSREQKIAHSEHYQKCIVKLLQKSMMSIESFFVEID